MDKSIRVVTIDSNNEFNHYNSTVVHENNRNNINTTRDTQQHDQHDETTTELDFHSIDPENMDIREG